MTTICESMGFLPANWVNTPSGRRNDKCLSVISKEFRIRDISASGRIPWSARVHELLVGFLPSVEMTAICVLMGFLPSVEMTKKDCVISTEPDCPAGSRRRNPIFNLTI